MTDLKVGDVVYLNSGSPKLTVTSVREEDVTVFWVGEHVTHQLTLPAACFTLWGDSVLPSAVRRVS